MAAFAQGEHICSVFETDAERIAAAADFLADGLRAGEQAYYAAESHAMIARFRSALRRRGIDVPAMVADGALLMGTPLETYLPDGSFETERMLRLVSETVEAALKAGFAGLRACGDMSWVIGNPPGAHQLMEYEGLLNENFAGIRAAAMCQYNAARLPPHVIDHALATHASVYVNRRHLHNPFHRRHIATGTRAPRVDDVDRKLGLLRRPS